MEYAEAAIADLPDILLDAEEDTSVGDAQEPDAVSGEAAEAIQDAEDMQPVTCKVAEAMQDAQDMPVTCEVAEAMQDAQDMPVTCEVAEAIKDAQDMPVTGEVAKAIQDAQDMRVTGEVTDDDFPETQVDATGDEEADTAKGGPEELAQEGTGQVAVKVNSDVNKKVAAAKKVHMFEIESSDDESKVPYNKNLKKAKAEKLEMLQKRLQVLHALKAQKKL